MRKYILPAIGALAGLAALYALLMWLLVWRFEVSTEDAYVQADIAAIAPKMSGYVSVIRVSDNQRVRRGDVLVELDTSDVQPKVDQARAQVAARKAGVATATAKARLQVAVIREAQAQLASAQADARRARADAQRYSDLGAKGYVSRQRVELARTDIGKADAAVSRAAAALEAERGMVPVLAAARAQAEADLGQAEAQLALAQAALADATLRAPFDGIVGNRTVQTGQFVRAGGQLMAVVPLPDVHVVANFKETQIGDMKVGQTVEVSVDALPGLSFTGRIESFAPASGALFSLLPPENATGNFTKIVQRIPVRIRLEGAADDLAKLRAGMSVGVVVDIHAAPAAPAAAGAKAP